MPIPFEQVPDYARCRECGCKAVDHRSDSRCPPVTGDGRPKPLPARDAHRNELAAYWAQSRSTFKRGL